MKRIILLFTIFAFGHLALAQNQTPVIVAKLPLGESVFLQNQYSIKFEKVIQDSRCPTNVDCVWPGEAKILLHLKKDGLLQEKKEIKLAGNNKMHSFSYGNKEIKIYNLAPYPASAAEKEKLAYYLQIDF
ncbi:hypothetical protein [Haloflavibacter putidus]|uniref:Uncharacterized protein n=1 Tax=Haloflavibacter putidus TaxID=2576776 RepID=A0A507ZT83_9FLAO|nr:hypothetical protein [Haloflavibacter putidus]TQD40609.1 hypothetical protein FKR84_01125 [Haloflavibacter putidus]